MMKIILMVLTFPIWFPLLLVAGAIILVISLAVSLSGFAITAVAAALSIAAVLAFIIYGGYIGTALATFMMGTGAGCILLGLGFLAGTAGISLCVKLFPWLINLLKNIFRKPFTRSSRELQVQGSDI